MAVGFVERALGSYSASASWVIARPTGTVDGMAMLLRLTIDRTTVTATTPAGWTLLDGPRDQTGAARSYLYGKVASSEPANYTVTLSGSASGSAALLSYSGTDPTAPFDLDTGSVSGSTATPSIALGGAPSVPNCMIVAFYGSDSNATKLPIGPDTSPVANERAETEASSGGRFYSTYAQDLLQTTAQNETLNINAAGADVWMMQIVALKPGGGGSVYTKAGLAAIGP